MAGASIVFDRDGSGGGAVRTSAPREGPFNDRFPRPYRRTDVLDDLWDALRQEGRAAKRRRLVEELVSDRTVGNAAG